MLFKKYDIYFILERGHRKDNEKLTPTQTTYFRNGKLVITTKYKNLDNISNTDNVSNTGNISNIDDVSNVSNTSNVNKKQLINDLDMEKIKESEEIIDILKNNKIEDFDDLFNILKSKEDEIKNLFPLIDNLLKSIILLVKNDYIDKELNEYKKISNIDFDKERQIIYNISKFILSMKGGDVIKEIERDNEKINLDEVIQETLDSAMKLIKENKISGINIVNKLAITEKDAFIVPDILLTNAYIRPGNKYQGGIYGVKGLLLALLETYNKYPDFDKYFKMHIYPRVSMFKYDLYEWDSLEVAELKKEKLGNEVYKDEILNRDVYIDIQPEFLFGFTINHKRIYSSLDNVKRFSNIATELTNNIYKNAGRYEITYLGLDEQDLKDYQTNDKNSWDLIDYRIKDNIFTIMNKYNGNNLKYNNNNIFNQAFQISGKLNDIYGATFMVAFDKSDVNNKLNELKKEIGQGKHNHLINKTDEELIKYIIKNKISNIISETPFKNNYKVKEIFIHKRMHDLVKINL